MTVCTPTDNSFEVAIIPYTFNNTNFCQIQVGTIVNLEFDIIGKYVEKLLRPAPEPRPQSRLTLEFLAENGF